MAAPLIYQNKRDAQGAAEANGMTPEIPGEEAGEQATEQEQAQYDDMASGGLKMLYDAEERDGLVTKTLQAESEKIGIATAIGQQAAKIMLAIVGGLKEQQLRPDAEVVLNAGVEVLAAIVELAENAKLVKPEEYDKVFEEASYEATRFYGDKEMQSGGITPEMQQEAQGIVSANMPKDQGSLAGMAQPQQPQQQPPQQGASLAQMTGAR